MGFIGSIVCRLRLIREGERRKIAGEPPTAGALAGLARDFAEMMMLTNDVEEDADVAQEDPLHGAGLPSCRRDGHVDGGPPPLPLALTHLHPHTHVRHTSFTPPLTSR